MIPAMHITAWANVAPWAELGQIEQDLIISRAIIEILSDEFLRNELRFRGGTALNKLHFPEPLRYSEDIDLVRTTHGPIGPILDRLREILDWLGDAAFMQSAVAPKLIYQIEPEHAGPPLRLKVEINTRETKAFDGPHEIEHAVDNPWFSGDVAIPTFTLEEMLATKLRSIAAT
jgi:predicted nucleotidyltransferase component of viral defense system